MSATGQITIAKRKTWYRDPSYLIGIGGVAATVIVGMATYWLTSGSVSREYLERAREARSQVLNAVTRSIGEGVVPSREKIQSVLDSVRRESAIKDQDFETTDMVFDDVISRVLSNEFLDAKRREELTNRLLAAKNEPGEPSKKEESAARETEFESWSAERRLKQAEFSALAGLAAAVLGLLSIVLLRGSFLLSPSTRIALMLTVLATITISTWLFFTQLSPQL